MATYIDLNGLWTLTGTDEFGKALSLPGTVPGCVHTDLAANGIVGDFFWRDNSKKVQWIENHDFTYTKTFTLTEVAENAWLEFDGLDTYATILLNGKVVGETDNMHIPHAFQVDGLLKTGENTLEVRFDSPIRRVEGLPLHPGAFTQERMNTRRIQCTYSWDWVDRFVTMGIYRDVRLAFRGQNEVESCYIYTADINPYAAQLKLEVAFRDFVDLGDTVTMKILDPDGNVVSQKERTILQDHLYEYIDVVSPKLWYPLGYGEQPLYTLSLTTKTSQKTEKFGIRTITVLQIEDPVGSEDYNLCRAMQEEEHLKVCDFNQSTACFTVLVNGVKVMCKGANWVPCDPFPSAESPEKITRLLELGVAGGFNMLRVWGGGIFERDEFYAECDRLGILATQDFLMACGEYPEDEDWFIEALKKEATAAALRLRNHPCLAFWSGDNENAVHGNENRTDFPGYRSAALGIEPVIARLDPNRRFFPSSPYGGDYYCSATRGTTHNTFYLGSMFAYIQESDFTDYRAYFNKFISRFCAEQPSFGLSFVSSLRKYMTEEDIFGDDPGMIEFHSKTNPGLPSTLFHITNTMAQKIFGDFENGADRVRKLQMLHCEWTRISFELYRRHKGFDWGMIYWMFNDCWPAAGGWAFLDYYACPKPAYYVFKRCATPVVATLVEEGGKLSLHVSNDAMEPVSGSAAIYCHNVVTGVDTPLVEVSFRVDENAAAKVWEGDMVPTDENTILLCDLTSTLGNDRCFLVVDRYKDTAMTYADPIILSEEEETITVTADRFLPYVMVDVPFLLSENCFPLKKGEIKILKKIRKL